MTDRFETKNANYGAYHFKAPKTYDDTATFTYTLKNVGETANCNYKLTFCNVYGDGNIKTVKETVNIATGETKEITDSASPSEINDRFISCELKIHDGSSYVDPMFAETIENFVLDNLYDGGEKNGRVTFVPKSYRALYVPETTPLATNQGIGSNYWATFSNQSADTEIGVPSGQSDVTLYNVKVKNGQMTLTPREGDYAFKVAKGDAVLIKADGGNVRLENLGTENSLSVQNNTDLVATPAEAHSIKAAEGNIFYRLTYGNMTNKTNLGFHIAVATVSGTQYTDGSWINATPGKGYLNIAKSDATPSAISSPSKAFIFDDDDISTAIEGVFVPESSQSGENTNELINNLQGQQVKTLGKGLYIKNNKKIIVK